MMRTDRTDRNEYAVFTCHGGIAGASRARAAGGASGGFLVVLARIAALAVFLVVAGEIALAVVGGF